MPEQLGERLYLVAMSVKGRLTEDVCVNVIDRIIDKIGMTKAPGWTINRYPVNGKGGEGFTIFQPITESFIALDVYDALFGGYLVICSCKEFVMAEVAEVMESVGLQVFDFRKSQVGLAE